jgi:hypothetical protein
MSGYGRGRGAKRGWWPKNKSWNRNQNEDVYYEDAEWEEQHFYEDEPVGNNRQVWINEDQRQQQQQQYNQPTSSFSFHCMKKVLTYKL